MRSVIRVWWVLAALLAVGASGDEALARAAVPGQRRHLVSNYLPAEVRQVIHARMREHGPAMTELQTAVLLLDYAEAGQLAEQIGGGPALKKAGEDGPGQVGGALPPLFFTFQDELSDRATALKAAARQKDSAQFARAFGSLTETCVSCHAVYMYRDNPLIR